jgi:probable HAF family extracellular repeat protein
MKFRKRLCFPAMAISALLATASPLIAQAGRNMHHHYKMIDLGTFGGPTNLVSSAPDYLVINDAGTIVGGADTAVLTPVPDCWNPNLAPDCYVFYAYAWADGELNELDTLPKSQFSFAAEINESGEIAGVSENGRPDPTTGNPEFRAVTWQNREIRDLGTFGGTASIAFSLNDWGQVTGVALNKVPDPYSILGNGSKMTPTQTRGFISQNGVLHDIGTLGGPDAWPMFINDRGQIAGASFTSDEVDPLTGTPPVDVFLWENGKMMDLGNLGGDNGIYGAPSLVYSLNNNGEVTGVMVLPGNQCGGAFLWNGQKLSYLGALGGCGSIGRGINDHGHVTGLALLPGNQTNHGFLWRNDVMTDLGTLNGDPCSDALAVNSKDQVVGASQSTEGGCAEWTTGFLWENNGPMADLNALVISGSETHLYAGFWMNRRGEIVAGGYPTVCVFGDLCDRAYLLIPCDENHPGIEGCDYSLVDATAMSPSSSARNIGNRSHAIQSPVSADPRDLARREMLARFRRRSVRP